MSDGRLVTKPRIRKKNHIPILHKLPLKSLFRCTTVCKSWRALINSPQFLSTHFQNPNQQLLLLRFHINNQEKLSLLFPDDHSLDQHIPIIPQFSQSAYIAGSFKGLLCVFLDAVSLWNPILGTTHTLPKLIFPARMGDRNVFGFGCSDENDYKVLHLLMTTHDNQEPMLYAEIFSLNGNSWKAISTRGTRNWLISNRAVSPFVNGALHWVASNSSIPNLIILFHMSREIFGRIELPESLMNVEINGLSVLPFGDSSIAVTNRTDDGVYTDIWVLKEYYVRGSWVKLPTVGDYARGRSSVLWIKDCENVLMEFSGGDGQIAWFNLENQRVMTVADNVKSVRCFPFVESLGLLKRFQQLAAAPAE